MWCRSGRSGVGIVDILALDTILDGLERINYPYSARQQWDNVHAHGPPGTNLAFSRVESNVHHLDISVPIKHSM